MDQKLYNWPRYWVQRGKTLPLSNSGYLYISEYSSDVVEFDKINHIPCLVLLGEPGIGKSRALRVEQESLKANLEKGEDKILPLDLRSFGSEDRLVQKLFENSVFLDWIDSDRTLYLFLDSLDECLLKIDTFASLLIDELHTYTNCIDRLFLRIACRTADWPITLEIGLIQLWGKDNVGIFELAPLRRVDVVEAVELNGIPSGEFLAEIEKKEAVPLVVKPITLKLLLNIYKRDSQLPQTKLEIYRKGCLLLCEDPNPRLRKIEHQNNNSSNKRMIAAAHIAAFTILANRYAVWTDIDEGDVPSEAITIQDIANEEELIDSEITIINEGMLMDAIASGLFTSRGSKLMGWAHQTYAEFLAAFFLERILTVEQIRQLLFSDERIVPQLRQTASWLAGFNQEVFGLIVKSDPQILLNSDIESNDIEGKSKLVEALLETFKNQPINYYQFDKYYSKLLHPNLVNQLTPYIFDKTISVNARCAAMQIAEECVLQGLDTQLLSIALDSFEPVLVRTSAASYIVRLGNETTKAKLKPLVLVQDQDSIADDLKYTAFEAIWPRNLTVKEMLSTLDQPTEETSMISLRSSMLRKFVEQLEISDLPIALEWVNNLPLRHDMSTIYIELMDSIMFRGWQHFQNPNVKAAFAIAAFTRITKYDAIVGNNFGISRRESHPGFANDLENYPEKRRSLVLALIALSNESKQLLSLLHSSPPLIIHDDFIWLIENFQHETSSISRNIFTEFIKRLFYWNINSHFHALFYACQNDPALDKALETPFLPIELNSDKGKELKSNYLHQKELEEKIHNESSIDPPPPEQVEFMLEKCESDHIDWWIRLTAALSLTPDHTRLRFDWAPSLIERPGWQNADEQTKEQIINVAKRFAIDNAPDNNDWIGTNRFPYVVLAGYLALKLLLECQPESLLEIPQYNWGKWTPIILKYPNESGKLQQTLAKIAYLSSPDLFIENLIHLVKEEGKGGHIVSLYAIKECWDEKLVTTLSQLLYVDDFTEDGLNSLLINLLEHESKQAKDFAESLIVNQDLSEEKIRVKAIFGATALLTRIHECNWNAIWTAIQTDREFGKAVFENVAMQARLTESFTTQLSEHELAELFIWLTHEYPHAEDPQIKKFHHITEREEVGHFRDAILHSKLANYGTPDACSEIQRIVDIFPHLELKSVLLHAEEVTRHQSWQPYKPKAIHQLIKDSQASLHQNPAQTRDIHIHGNAYGVVQGNQGNINMEFNIGDQEK